MTTTSTQGNPANPLFLVAALVAAAVLIYMFYTAFIPSMWHMNPPSSGFDFLVN